MWTRAAILTMYLVLAGCATGTLPLGYWRESPRPSWYDKTKGPGAPYQDAEGTYYIWERQRIEQLLQDPGGEYSPEP